MQVNYRQLDAEKIIDTIQLLVERIDDRFPEAGLGQVCRQLLEISQQARQRSEWIARPIVWLRMTIWLLIGVVLLGLAGTAITLRLPLQEVNFVDFVQVLEAGLNELVLVGAGIFFLASLEKRIKRRRALAAIHELRSIAHIIDMHQLTKDPERLLEGWVEARHSPARRLSPFELERYLDYCGEMLSLTGKVAALYVQRFEDEVLLVSVNEVESLTTSLSRKIWQKIMILHTIPSPGTPPAAAVSPEPPPPRGDREAEKTHAGS